LTGLSIKEGSPPRKAPNYKFRPQAGFERATNKTMDLKREVQQITRHNHAVISAPCATGIPIMSTLFFLYMRYISLPLERSKDFNDVCLYKKGVLIFVKELSQPFPTGSKENHLKSEEAYLTFVLNI
jgi:hypothetical protein